jgi:predicted amidohydrolase YtcJ
MSALIIRNAVPWSAGQRLNGDAVAIRDGVIVAVGDHNSVRAALPSRAREWDARGGLVTAGFVDAHVHLGIVAKDSLQCDLAGAASVEEIHDRIRRFAESSTGHWVLGGGWDRALFPPSGPTARELDTIVADRPALFHDADHHAAWANSAALAAAGITAATPDPPDGRIERGPDGVPSGFLAEGAVNLLSAVLPEADSDELAAAIIRASADLHSVGVTGWQEAALGAFAGFPDFTESYRRALAGGLRGRPTGAIWVPRDLTASGVEAFVRDAVSRAERNTAFGFPTSTVKLMLDGIVETRTAALLDPYVADDAARGLSYFTPEVIQRVIPAANDAGLSVHVHAIGDRAVRDALDGFANVPAEVRSRVRNHIAHLQLIADQDVPRFAKLNVTANIQPYWASTTPLTREATIPLLGPARVRLLFRFGSLHAAGSVLAMGSDWPVSSNSPWQALHVAVTRRNPDSDAPPLGAEEALPLSVVLDAATRGSAELLGIPGGGLLTVGAPADLTIANRDPFDHPEEEVHLTEPVATIIGGEVVFSR